MLAEMEFTGQAFEEMQEQNVRLLQQLREKDDANLKLMSEVRQNISRPSLDATFLTVACCFRLYNSVRVEQFLYLSICI